MTSEVVAVVADESLKKNTTTTNTNPNKKSMTSSEKVYLNQDTLPLEEDSDAASSSSTSSSSLLSPQQEKEKENVIATQEEPLLGIDEKCLFEPEKEKKGVQDILKQLSKQEISEMPDCNMPLRYFRAEKGDVTKAVEKLKATLQWRKDFDVHSIVHAFDEKYKDDPKCEKMRSILKEEAEPGKIYVRGYNHEGRALLYMCPARENTTDIENNMKHLVYNIERAIACTKQRTNGRLEKIIMIINYEGFKLRNAPPMKSSQYFLNIVQNHYPERLFKSFCCNPPFIFKTFYAMVRPFIDPITKDKVVMSGDDKSIQSLQASICDPLDQNIYPHQQKTLKPFNSTEYLNVIPFHRTFDE